MSLCHGSKKMAGHPERLLPACPIYFNDQLRTCMKGIIPLDSPPVFLIGVPLAVIS
ncbi:hypothetical protein NBO_664g0001 [Nosema bombycis CQ1]|uniref:Uncharacterized protein n=1 Tax=Nosema bombycis (strain CQ1 / CVCC 102059) TaxID=578461 RepID=R0MGN4_NOSB1|nr:hypothetical protein NBO_664g0001 [Nosema bombycis CQ1]|eukprot:EOB11898.1 hypothetical protein NBO_664g0001 [Nosema bombycis CQ1]